MNFTYLDIRMMPTRYRQWYIKRLVKHFEKRESMYNAGRCAPSPATAGRSHRNSPWPSVTYCACAGGSSGKGHGSNILHGMFCAQPRGLEACYRGGHSSQARRRRAELEVLRGELMTHVIRACA